MTFQKETAEMYKHSAADQNEQGYYIAYRQNSQDESLSQEVEMTCMRDIPIEPIAWLWPDRIACGKLTVIAGNPGLGKSQITASLAAIVSGGKEWPDTAEHAASGSVIFLSAEDDAADTIKPRLIAADADINRCHILTAIKTLNKLRSFDLTQDVGRLASAIDKIGDVRLVIIDPISAYLGDTDSHNNSDMRGLLAPLAAMAAKYKVAIILVTHLNKSKEQDMIARITGSIGLIAAARAGYVVIKDEKKPEIRFFIPLKNNIGNDGDGFSFQIEGKILEQNIKTSRVRWSPNLVDAHKVLYPEQDRQMTETTGAGNFLQELLSQGPMQAKAVFENGDGAGYSKASLQRAARRIGIKRKKEGMSGGWIWSICSTGNSNSEACEDGSN